MEPNTRFGKLIVLKKATRKGYVTCRCDCGNIVNIRTNSLTMTKNPTRSCGCLQKAVAKETGTRTIARNSARQIATNVHFNTNFQVIENPTPPKNNVSGCKGVWWDNRRGQWQAYISLHGKRHNLGRFHKYEDAVKARRAAEEELFTPLINQKNASGVVE